MEPSLELSSTIPGSNIIYNIFQMQVKAIIQYRNGFNREDQFCII
jgi:hypothetical protein